MIGFTTSVFRKRPSDVVVTSKTESLNKMGPMHQRPESETRIKI